MNKYGISLNINNKFQRLWIGELKSDNLEESAGLTEKTKKEEQEQLHISILFSESEHGEPKLCIFQNVSYDVSLLKK